MTTEIDAEGLAAAEVAWRASIRPTCKGMLSEAIRACLSASRSTSEAEPVAFIQREVLAELAKHKDATGTIASGLLRKPFGDPVPLYTLPTPAGDDQVVDWQRAAMDETVRQISSMLSWGDVPLSKGDVALVDHIKGMPERMTPDFSPAKIGRWLGWVQGVACAKGWLHLDDCKRINKTASDAITAMGSTKP